MTSRVDPMAAPRSDVPVRPAKRFFSDREARILSDGLLTRNGAFGFCAAIAHEGQYACASPYRQRRYGLWAPYRQRRYGLWAPYRQRRYGLWALGALSPEAIRALCALLPEAIRALFCEHSRNATSKYRRIQRAAYFWVCRSKVRLIQGRRASGSRSRNHSLMRPWGDGAPWRLSPGAEKKTAQPPSGCAVFRLVRFRSPGNGMRSCD